MARLTQQQVEDWIAKNGGPSAVQYGVEQKQIKNPDIASPDPYVNIEVEVWRAYDPRTGKPTGAELTVRRDPDKGDFEQIENKSAAPPAPSSQTATTGRVEGTPMPGGGFDNSKPIWVERDANGQQVGPSKPLTADQRAQWERDKNGGLTDDEVRQQNQTAETRQPVPTHPGYTQVTTKKGTTTETYYLDPNGNRVNGLPEKPTTAALVGSPTGNIRQRNEGGKTIKEVEYVLPNGTKEWRSQTTPAEGTTVDLAGAPQLDLSSPERARATYNELFLFVDRKVRSGELSAEKGKAYLAGPHSAVANVLDAAAEQRTIAENERRAGENLRRDQLTERSQDMTQAGNRLSFGQTAAQAAIKTSADLVKAAEGGESTIVPLMVLQAGMGQAMGGFRESPSVTMGSGLLPAVAQRAGAGFVAPPASPATAGQGNQIGAGAIGSLPAPLLPPRPMTSSPATTTPAPAGRAVPVAPAVPAVSAPAPAAPSGPPERDNWRNDPSTPPVNMDPSQGPVGIMPIQILKSGMGTRTADDLERELLAEGYSVEEVRAARRRAEARAGIGMTA